LPSVVAVAQLNREYHGVVARTLELPTVAEMVAAWRDAASEPQAALPAEFIPALSDLNVFVNSCGTGSVVSRITNVPKPVGKKAG
jgi:hypothetical protein